MVTTRPRAGSQIWRRIDVHQTLVVESSVHESAIPNFAADEAGVSTGTWIYDRSDTATEFEVEAVRYDPDDGVGIVVLAPSTPPFGKWVDIPEWPS